MAVDGENGSSGGHVGQMTMFDEPGKTPGDLLPQREPLSIVGLFAGIGGVELGLSRSGHHAKLLCEIDDIARSVLDARFPDVPKHRDVTELRDLPEGTELVAGGFPCQDLSQAGLTRGIRGARSGLVGEVFRLVEGRRVPWLLLENVPFMLALAGGEALEVIVAGLEHHGYRWAYRVVNTRAFGLPQRRERVYMVASLDEDPRDVLLSDDAGEAPTPAKDEWREAACGFYWTEGVRGLGWAHDSVPTLKGGSTVGIPSAPAIVMPDGSVVKPDIRDAERLQGFEPDWTLPAEDVARAGFRWKLVGNAVTVNVAEWVGRRLAHPRRYDPTGDTPMNRTRAWPRAGYNVDGQRMTALVSSWPVHEDGETLADFLRYPTVPLSPKATRGFLHRASSPKCGLRFPDGFIDVMRAHLETVDATP